MPDPISTTLGKIAVSIVVSTLKSGYKAMTTIPPFRNAATQTQDKFPDLIIEPALAKWCGSDAFGDVLSAVKVGEAAIANDLLVKSFIEVGEFYVAENCQALAEQVLTLFFQNLEAEIIRSTDGLVAVARQQLILHEQTRDVIRDTVNPITDELASIKASLTAMHSSLPDVSDSENSIEERIYHARIEEARNILEAGKPKTARERLEILRKEIEKKNPSKSLLYRIATNLGSCAIQLDDNETAIREVEFAYRLEPENPVAISNASTAALLQNKPELAMELAAKAREKAPRDSVAMSNYIHALFTLGKLAEISGLLESNEWIKKDVNCCFTIGYHLFETNRYEEAESHLRAAIASDPDVPEPRVLALLAHSLIRPAQLRYSGGPVLNWRFPPEFFARLREVVHLLSRAITLQQSSEDRRFLELAYLLRADARRMSGDDTGAIADCDAVLTEAPHDQTVYQIKALALLHLRQAGEATECFEKVTDATLRDKMLVPMATAYLAAGAEGKAIDLVTPHWKSDSNDPKQVQFASLLISAHGQRHETDTVENIIAQLRSKWPSQPDALCAIGRHRKRQGKLQEAIGLLSEALSCCTSENQDLTALELADLYYADNQFAKAADLYGSVADTTSANEITERYVVCLYNAGSLKEAFDLSVKIRNDGVPIPIISQVEAKVLIEMGDLPKAQSLLERLANLNPTIFEYRIEAAECAIRQGQSQRASEMLSVITVGALKGNSRLLMRVAQLRALLEMPEVIQFAYAARRSGFADPKMHGTYLQLFSSRKTDSKEFTCDGVAVDCSVTIDGPEGPILQIPLTRPRHSMSVALSSASCAFSWPICGIPSDVSRISRISRLKDQNAGWMGLVRRSSGTSRQTKNQKSQIKIKNAQFTVVQTVLILPWYFFQNHLCRFRSHRLFPCPDRKNRWR